MATLSGYIVEVRRLLHDANGNFYSDSELTDYINSARERVVRDTGCLRTLQVSQTPIAPAGAAAQPTIWTASTAVSLNQYIFYNIFLYQVTTAGVTDVTGPPYPNTSSGQTAAFPPSTEFFNGTAGLTYVGNIEIIPYSSLPDAANTLDVLNINIFWGNSRIPLQYMPWSQFNAQMRYWQNYVGRPIVFSIYGQSQIYIGPIPDQVYTMELDTVIMPTALVNNTDIDQIVDPYTVPVAYYAAHKAKFKEQSFGESEIFKQQYDKLVANVLNSTFTRRIPDPYSSFI